MEGDHGRIESREVVATEDIAWLKERHNWKGLRSIFMVVSRRQAAKGQQHERRFYISSLPADAPALAGAIRAHWGVENRVHWILDVQFRDDDCRIRKRNTPANFSAVKRAALNALRKAPGKDSLKPKNLIAVVRPLSDDELVLALGRENAERRDPSYIERAFFAKELGARGFSPEITRGALAVDNTEITRLLQVGSREPALVVSRVGPAPKAGRLRWLELSRLIELSTDPGAKPALTFMCSDAAAFVAEQLPMLYASFTKAKQDDPRGGVRR